MHERSVFNKNLRPLAALAALSLCLCANAQSPIDYVEGFEPAGDNDTFVPTNDNPTSVPPYNAANYPGELPGMQPPNDDWFDSRTGSTGLIEEVASGDPLFGSVISHTGSGHAVVYPFTNGSYSGGFRDSAFGRLGRQTAFPAGGDQWAYQVDLFAESVPTPGGLLDYFWWTNAVQNSTTTYLTESGFQIHPGPASWSFTTTAGGNPIATLPSGVWYHLETVFDRSGPSLVIHHRIYNASRTAVMYSHTIPASQVFLGPIASGDVGGPRYMWFTAWNDNIVDHVYVDNVGTRSGAAQVDLVATDSCLNSGDTQLVVEVRMSNAMENVVGGEFHLLFDNTALAFVSMVPGDATNTDPNNPFGTEIDETVAGSQIDYAVGVNPFSDPGTTGDVVMARITFNIISGTERCAVADLVSFDTANIPPSRLTNDDAQPVPATFNDLGAVTIDQVAPTLICPPNIVVNADAGPCTNGAVVLPGIQTFTTPPVLGATQAPGVWYVDRYAPCGFASAVFDGDARLKHSICASDCSTCRPPAFSSAFYDTQGRKYDTPDATSMTIDLYVPASWATSGKRMAGFWGTGFDALNTVSSFPIIEFTNSPDGSGLPRFRGWDNGVWIDMGLPTGFTYDRWYTLKIDLVGGNWVYRVGNLSLTVTNSGSVQIGNVILQGHNTTAGVTYDIHWDNFATNRPTFFDNCDADAILSVLPVQPGNVFPTGTTILTWTATDACGNFTQCNQTVTVNSLNTVVATVELKDVYDPMTRGITFEFFNGGSLEDTRCANVAFTDHDSNGATAVRGTVTFSADCGGYDCITVRDTLHSLRRTISTAPEFTIVGTQYAVEATSSGANDDSLMGGNVNDDRFIDILDFGGFAGQFGDTVGASTPCGTLPLHADFSGNGTVGPEDYTFISAYFLLAREVSCDLSALAGGGDEDAGPITRISVRELLARGMRIEAQADFNHDGWLDTLDIQVFLNGGVPPNGDGTGNN